MAKIGVVSLGCSKNQIDCEHMLSLLDEAGYELTVELNDVSAVIINTCGFIGDARDEAYEYIQEAITLKGEGSIGKIIVTGCLSELLKDKLHAEFPEIDALVGCGSYLEIVDVCEKVFAGEYVESFGKPNEAPLECGRILTTPPYTAFIKIAEGCSNACAYCVIPRLRGKLRSREMDEIIKEAEALVESGARELIVVAQDTGSYGSDLEDGSNLAKLLTRLSEIDGLEWIRIHYLYADKISDELIDVIAKNEKIVKYLGITLFPQAGVALGMAAQALTFGGEIGVLAQSITLFAVLIYELVGPALTKIALTKAGDIKAEGKTNAREEAKKAMENK